MRAHDESLSMEKEEPTVSFEGRLRNLRKRKYS